MDESDYIAMKKNTIEAYKRKKAQNVADSLSSLLIEKPEKGYGFLPCPRSESAERYQTYKNIINAKEPYKFGQTKYKKDLKNLVEERDKMLKNCVLQGRPQIAENLKIIKLHWIKIHDYMKEIKQTMEDYSAMEYNTTTAKEINTMAKAIFSGFRTVIADYGVVRGKIPDKIRVGAEEAGQFGDLLSTMRIVSEYEGDIRKKMVVTKELQELFDVVKFNDANGFGNTLTAANDDEQAYLTALGRSKLVNILHCIGSRHRILLEAWEPVSAWGKQAKADAQAALLVVNEEKQSPYDAQEANLDRMFHFLWKLNQAYINNPKGVWTYEVFEKICTFLNFNCKSFISQKDLVKKCLESGHTILSKVKFDNLSAEGAGGHKFQNPFLVTPKRFGNGACCFTTIGNVGQFLWSTQKMKTILLLWKNEQAMAHIHGCDDYYYFMTRVTFWFAHNTFKKSDVLPHMYTGEMTGNALLIEFE